MQKEFELAKEINTSRLIIFNLLNLIESIDPKLYASELETIRLLATQIHDDHIANKHLYKKLSFQIDDVKKLKPKSIIIGY